MKFDMILVVAREDYKILDIVIKNSNKYICPNNIYIITPRKDIDIHKENFADYNNVTFIDEQEIICIDSVDFKKIKLPGFPGRRFWYYQQFLKMAFSYSKYCLNEYYLIWDADTIPLKPLKFISNNNKIFLTTSNNEYHKEYFINIQNILNIKVQIYNKSFISQHLFVKKKHMIELISKIGSIQEHKWIDILLSKLSGKSQSLFSEYETYANFVLNFHRREYEIRTLKWFRRGAFIIKDVNQIDKFAKYYDFIAYEKSDISFFKSFFFYFYYLTTRKLNNNRFWNK